MKELKYLVTKTKYPLILASSLGISYAGFLGDYLLNMELMGLIGTSGLALTATSIIGGIVYFIFNKDNIAKNIEEKLFLQYKKDIQEKYHDIGFDSNIFKKIDTLRSLLSEQFSNSSTFSIRMFQTINNSLALYVENLEIIKVHKELEQVTNKSYSDEINKNLSQNNDIIDNLDRFIEEMALGKGNDSKMEDLVNTFETSVNLFNKLKSIK